MTLRSTVRGGSFRCIRRWWLPSNMNMASHPSGVVKRAADGPYAVLLLDASCTQEQVKKAYKRLSLEYHPDKCRDDGAAEAFIAISDAYALLSDGHARSRYDEQARRRRDAEDGIRERREKQRQQEEEGKDAMPSNEHQHQHQRQQRGNPDSRRAFGSNGRSGLDPNNAQSGEGGGGGGGGGGCASPTNGDAGRERGHGEEKKAASASSKGWAPKATTGAKAASSFAEFRAKRAAMHARAETEEGDRSGTGIGVGGGESGCRSEDRGGADDGASGWRWSWGGEGGARRDSDPSDEARLREALRRFKEELGKEQQARRDVAMVSELLRRGVKVGDVGVALAKSRSTPSTMNQRGFLSAAAPNGGIEGLNLRALHDGDRMVMLGAGGESKDVFVWLSRQHPFVLQWRVCDAFAKSAAPDGGIVVQAIRKVVRIKDAGGAGGGGAPSKEGGVGAFGAGGSVFAVSSGESDLRLRASGHEEREEWVVALQALSKT